MSVEKLIDTVTEWTQINICDHVKLKQPPPREQDPEDEDYKYILVNPVAFPMYVPTREKLPPNIHSVHPSLCVGFTEGEDQAAQNSGSVEVQLAFSAWNPGIHGGDLLRPDGKGGMNAQDAKRYFQRSADGWRDIWQFVDVALRAVESVTIIGNYSIDRAAPIKFGPVPPQEAIPDFYPYWFAWVSFRVTYPLMRNVSEIQDLL